MKSLNTRNFEMRLTIILLTNNQADASKPDSYKAMKVTYLSSNIFRHVPSPKVVDTAFVLLALLQVIEASGIPQEPIEPMQESRLAKLCPFPSRSSFKLSPPAGSPRACWTDVTSSFLLDHFKATPSRSIDSWKAWLVAHGWVKRYVPEKGIWPQCQLSWCSLAVGSGLTTLGQCAYRKVFSLWAQWTRVDQGTWRDISTSLFSYAD